jgi:hypothetical protein
MGRGYVMPKKARVYRISNYVLSTRFEFSRSVLHMFPGVIVWMVGCLTLNV